MLPLKQQLLQSLRIEGVMPVLVPIRALDDELWDLHQRSAAGRTTAEEEARLNRLCAEREAAWIDENGGGE